MQQDALEAILPVHSFSKQFVVFSPSFDRFFEKEDRVESSRYSFIPQSQKMLQNGSGFLEKKAPRFFVLNT